eukprot:m.76579 g.76579  ORF g.76579 m.76579 type:complete len:322 (-) comp24915_c0_seq1:54-1019(-)
MASSSPAIAEPSSPFRNDILNGRVVLITGGATGIGYSIAKAFGEHGAKVAIAARRENVINDAVASLRDLGIDAFGTRVDVRDSKLCLQTVQTVFDHFGRIDYLVNNAAGNFVTSLESLTPNGFATVLGIDLQGVLHMSKAVLPFMKKTSITEGACIINITATLQDIVTPFQAHAAAAKAGIDVLTDTMGVEWGEYNIRTIGLAPGGIAGTVGGPGGRVFGNNENNAAANKVGSVSGNAMGEPAPNIVRNHGYPSGRWGRVDDVALAAVFMCSSAAPWITATRLVIDGGSRHRVVGFGAMKAKIEEKSLREKSSFKGGVSKL